MKKLGEEDRNRLLEYVCKEPEMNLFFIGDIENYGIDTDEVSIYAWEDGQDWDCVLLRYFDFYIIYSQKEKYQAADVAEFLRERTVDCISGKTELVRQIMPFYPEMKIEETLMCRCNRSSLEQAGLKDGQICSLKQAEMSDDQICSLKQAEMKDDQICSPKQDDTDDDQIRRLTVDDVPAMMELYLQIEEFAASYQNPDKSREQLVADMEKGELTVGMFRDRKLVSLAKTSASNSMSAMIVGVATAPDARKKGYASAVVKELCRQSFAENREFLCLFYDNPEAGRIYRRIGFRELGSYSMLR